MGKIKIITLHNAGTQCPTQWYGKTDNNEDVYIRYRWGKLRVDIYGKEAYTRQLEDGADGYLTYDELKRELSHVFELPNEETKTCSS